MRNRYSQNCNSDSIFVSALISAILSSSCPKCQRFGIIHYDFRIPYDRYIISERRSRYGEFLRILCLACPNRWKLNVHRADQKAQDPEWSPPGERKIMGWVTWLKAGVQIERVVSLSSYWQKQLKILLRCRYNYHSINCWVKFPVCAWRFRRYIHMGQWKEPTWMLLRQFLQNCFDWINSGLQCHSTGFMGHVGWHSIKKRGKQQEEGFCIIEIIDNLWIYFFYGASCQVIMTIRSNGSQSQWNSQDADLSTLYGFAKVCTKLK